MPGADDPLSIVQATPHIWGSGHQVDRFVTNAGEELTRRGHRVVVLAPAPSRAAFREAKRRVEAAIERPESLFEGAEGPVVLDVGGVPATGANGARRTPVPGESAKLVERLLATVPFDILHVHDPFMPSLGSTALRHSFTLNVGSFHEPQERLLSTHLARPLVEIFLGRLDARTVSGPATGELLNRYFPGPFEEITAGADGMPWAEAADRLEAIYRRITARRHPTGGDPELHRRLAKRPLIEVDLHMHTDHSPDCATPVRVLLETARDRGLGAIAITDHNEISGALAAREVAAEIGGIEVIVGEEVMTASQGEVIGLFLNEKIERGMTMAETIAEIRRQGGLVYMPHPFDRLHSVPDYENLIEVVEEIDFMEVFNPRVAISSFNEEAERFARKYRIIPAAGSDSHVAQGLGSVRLRIPTFEGPEEFREAMRDAEITRRHKNLVYVQALKFLQTSGRPKAAKRELEVAAPVRGGRPRRRV